MDIFKQDSHTPFRPPSARAESMFRLLGERRSLAAAQASGMCPRDSEGVPSGKKGVQFVLWMTDALDLVMRDEIKRFGRRARVSDEMQDWNRTHALANCIDYRDRDERHERAAKSIWKRWFARDVLFDEPGLWDHFAKIAKIADPDSALAGPPDEWDEEEAVAGLRSRMQKWRGQRGDEARDGSEGRDDVDGDGGLDDDRDEYDDDDDVMLGMPPATSPEPHGTPPPSSTVGGARRRRSGGPARQPSYRGDGRAWHAPFACLAATVAVAVISSA